MSVDSSESSCPPESLSLPLNSLRKDPRTLTNLSELLSCLSALQSEEAEHSTSLTELLNAREPFLVSLKRLNSLVPHVDTLLADAAVLSNNVTNTAKTAERVGGRVRSLDDEMGRVREAGDRVGQVMELKASLADLQSSIEIQDWEAAARHCARAMSLPLNVISGPFAETAVPTSESHLPPAQTLQQAREKLLAIFRRNFEKASQSRDSTATSRFFKLFPAIGWEDEGLEAYASFVVDLVRVRAPASAKSSSPLYYITTLTALFESIAMIVDQHQPVVEKYYGPGKMRTVTKRLLSECDRVVKGIIEGWEEERAMKRKLVDITSNPPILASSTSNRRPPAILNLDEAAVDPREIDRVLSELAGMIGRWSLFRKFLLESLADDMPHSAHSDDHNPQKGSVDTPRIPLPHDTTYIDSTESRQLFSSLVATYYIPLEVWYTRTSIDKVPANILHSIPHTDALPGSPPVQLISRLLSTGDVKGTETTFEQLREVIEQDYIGVIRKKLEDVYRHTGAPNSVSRGDKAERDNRVAFIKTILNDLDISSSHLEHLMHDLSGSQTIGQHFTEEHQPLVKTTLATFLNLNAKLRSALRNTFTENNYRLFFGLALDVVLRPWEKYVTSLKFTELGAIRFDRDLRSITTFLASQTAFGDAREKFVRLQQISTLLNLDSEEDVDEFYNSSGITWKLSSGEARAIGGLKL
ncbi:hypothetical protein H0H87_010274 [Tephrocybe sp. NHM501043]|nr:hypothetical protein H0H87_010274 [Tephrocybe sp. NHM501043]